MDVQPYRGQDTTTHRAMPGADQSRGRCGATAGASGSGDGCESSGGGPTDSARTGSTPPSTQIRVLLLRRQPIHSGDPRRHRPRNGSQGYPANISKWGWPSGFAGSITMQLATTVDASPAGGSSTAPLRIRYTFDPALVAGSGPFLVVDKAASYAPVQKVTIKIGDQCAVTGGTGNLHPGHKRRWRSADRFLRRRRRRAGRRRLHRRPPGRGGHLLPLRPGGRPG